MFLSYFLGARCFHPSGSLNPESTGHAVIIYAGIPPSRKHLAVSQQTQAPICRLHEIEYEFVSHEILNGCMLEHFSGVRGSWLLTNT